MLPRALNVGFAGTPDFARAALLALIDSRHHVALALSQPDRPSGRGLRLTASPVKNAAVAAGIEVLQPAGLKLDGRYAEEAAATHERLRAASLDVLVVAAYGLILPQSVLDIPSMGCLNIHASLLPRWRGAAPVQRAIEAGDRETGVDIMQMDAGLDTGDVLHETRCAIEAKDTAASLTERLAQLGAAALLDTLDGLTQGVVTARPQAKDGATYATKISKAEAFLDWREPAELLERRIRAFDPFPGASTSSGKQSFKVWQASVKEQRKALQPGQIVFIEPAGIGVACASGTLVLEVLQRAGARRTSAAEFQQTQGLKVGEVLT